MAQEPTLSIAGTNMMDLQTLMQQAVQSGRDERAGLIEALKSQRNTSLDHSAQLSSLLANAQQRIAQLENQLDEEKTRHAVTHMKLAEAQRALTELEDDHEDET